MSRKNKKRWRRVAKYCMAALAAAAVLFLVLGGLLRMAGGFLVHTDDPVRSDVVVILNTGVEIYPRLMQAATLYREGFAERVVINGDRKSDALRRLEKMGFDPCCPWYEDSVRMLGLMGVPRERIIPISACDAYDTVSEANAVGRVLAGMEGVSSIIVTTSRYHTKRAHFIWNRSFGDRFSIRTVAARDDPFSPQGWWRDGRQIRWVMAEYGAWAFYAWKSCARLRE